MNVLMKRFKANPALAVDQFREAQAAFMDFTDLPDYQTMLQAGAHAREMFMALPPEVRFKFPSHDIPIKNKKEKKEQKNIHRMSPPEMRQKWLAVLP